MPHVAAEQVYVEDFSAVGAERYAEAQREEREFWSSKSRVLLIRGAGWRYLKGRREWRQHRELINPFRIDPTRPVNFGLQPQDVAGAVVVDVGCGPVCETLSLVHCATVHVVDPLLAYYRRRQPFGWWAFASAHACGAEALPFETASIDIVHCRNVLDHTRNAEEILCEIGRVLRPAGRFLLNCDLRDRGGGPAHPYKWSREMLEERIFAQFEPVSPPAVIQAANPLDADGKDPAEQRHWICSLRKR